MADLSGWLKKLLFFMHDHNVFAKYMGMRIINIFQGESIVSMEVTKKHTNIQGEIHGGGLVSLADMAMGLACNSLGKKLVTLDLSISFIHRAGEGDIIKAHSRVIHNGKSTMVVASDIKDASENLLAKARATFFVIGEYTPKDIKDLTP